MAARLISHGWMKVGSLTRGALSDRAGETAEDVRIWKECARAVRSYLQVACVFQKGEFAIGKGRRFGKSLICSGESASLDQDSDGCYPEHDEGAVDAGLSPKLDPACQWSRVSSEGD